tara:strand:+ start:93 stop:398 length:306 start_codon:yes stop_codon:yes gene_type:complete
MILQKSMALTGFEIAIGGITSIPVTAGLVFLGYKIFGEKQLDVSKLKPKKVTQPKKAEPTKETSKSKKSDDLKKDSDKTKSGAKTKSVTVEKNTTENKKEK